MMIMTVLIASIVVVVIMTTTVIVIVETAVLQRLIPVWLIREGIIALALLFLVVRLVLGVIILIEHWYCREY